MENGAGAAQAQPQQQAQTDPVQAGTQTQQSAAAAPAQAPQAQNGPAGVPDNAQMEQRYKQQWEAQKKISDDLQAKLDDAKTAEDIEKAKAAAQADADAAVKAAEEAYKAETKRLRVENALLSAGCVDAQAAMAHIDMDKVEVASDGHVSGFDAAAMQKERPYLFKQQAATVSTGAADNGGTAQSAAPKSIHEAFRQLAEQTK